MNPQPKRKKICDHEGTLVLYRSSIDGKFFFHCHKCRTVLGKAFSTKVQAENYAAKAHLPAYSFGGKS